MFYVELDKERIECYLRCLKEKKPFEPADIGRGWKTLELLSLAGVLYLHLSRCQAKALISQQDDNEHSEHIETVELQSREDALSAINFIGGLAGDIDDGVLNEDFERLPGYAVKVKGNYPKLVFTPATDGRSKPGRFGY